MTGGGTRPINPSPTPTGTHGNPTMARVWSTACGSTGTSIGLGMTPSVSETRPATSVRLTCLSEAACMLRTQGEGRDLRLTSSG